MHQLRILLLLLTICCSVLAGSVFAASKTYTLDGDFDEGTLLNINHNAPNGDQLQLDSLTTPFPFVYIANSERGTAVRIDVETGAILGEFLTAPNGRGRNPSRTTVDLYGNVWVSNRDESVSGMGSLVRIGLVIGGTRCDADGTANPAGQYLKPPFEYNTCVDRDGDGMLKTSFGLGNILPWTNTGGVDNNGGVTTAEDEAIINYTRTVGTGTRTVAIDANNDVWVGGLGDLDHEKISGVTGQPIAGTQFNYGCGGYGGLIDGNGVLWSSRGGSGLLRYDPATASHMCFGGDHGNYGLGVDPKTGHIWHSNLEGNRIAELDANGALLHAYSHGDYYAQGVAIDNDSNVWVAHSLYRNTVGHIRTNGVFVGNVALPGGSGPTGVAVDANGKIWVANINSDNAMRIDPNAGPIGGGGYPVGAVDLVVNLGAGAGPYNYSDMTGFVSIGATSPSGTWTVVYDGGEAGLEWGKASWNSLVPVGAELEVEVRTADALADLPSQTFTEVLNETDFSGLFGRYIEIRVSFRRGTSETSPVLYDLTIEPIGAVEVAVDIKPTSCPNPLNLRPYDVGDITEMMYDWTEIDEKDPSVSASKLVPSGGTKPPQAVVPVAILGTADFDVTSIDPTTVRLLGVAPLRVAYQDMTAPVREDADECECTTAGPDGYTDLTLKFSKAELIAQLGPRINGSYVELSITGMLKDGETEIIGSDCVLIRSDILGVDLTAESGNYPNPFNPVTNIVFSLPASQHVTVEIFNTSGQKVATLADRNMPAGHNQVVWNAAGQASGIYLYRITTATSTETRKMVLLK